MHTTYLECHRLTFFGPQTYISVCMYIYIHIHTYISFYLRSLSCLLPYFAGITNVTYHLMFISEMFSLHPTQLSPNQDRAHPPLNTGRSLTSSVHSKKINRLFCGVSRLLHFSSCISLFKIAENCDTNPI